MDALELANTADHPALSFLNTRVHRGGVDTDLLAGGRSLLTWLGSAGLLAEGERARAVRRFRRDELDRAAEAARDLREWLRPTVWAWVDSGGSVPAVAVLRLNRVLAQDTRHPHVDVDTDGTARITVRHAWTSAAELLALPAEAAADLLVNGDPDLVRQCDGPRCTIAFYDRTRAHRRRWCAMAVCGNRDKVRNHRARTLAAS